MPYVDRDQRGAIVAAYARPQRKGHESVAKDDTELRAFTNRPVIKPERETPAALVTSSGPVAREEFSALQRYLLTLI